MSQKATRDFQMHIEIDKMRCQGHGRCLDTDPDVFGYDDVTNLAFVLDTADLAAHRRGIQEAANACPESAISLSDDGDTITATTES
jgi:ferredoxin